MEKTSMGPDGRIFVVHGWATDSRVWAGSGLCAVDLSGHGRNKKRWHEPTIAAAVEEIQNALGAEKTPVAIGWSLGAQALIKAAEKMKFRGLILVGATPSFIERDGFPWGKKKSLIKRMLMDLRENPLETLRRFYALNFTEEERLKPEAESFLKLYEKPAFDFESVENALASLMNTDLREEITKIDAPTLLIHGGRDAVTSVEAARYMAERMKRAELAIFENSGHAPFIAESRRFEDAIKKFIARL